jgi:hypothetical protein
MTHPRESLYKYNRGLYRYNINPTVVTGNFTIGAAATFYETQIGQGSIVARTGAGLYTITLDDLDVVEVLSATAYVEDRAGAHTDLIARVEDVAVAAGVATIDIECYDAVPAAVDVLTANNLYCHYQIIYSRAWQGQPSTRPVGYYHHASTPTLVVGRIDVAAAGAPTLANGAGFAVAGGGGTGIYTLTFTEAFNQFLSGQVNAGNASAAGGDLSATFGAFTAGAAGAATLEIYTQAAAVATDPANGGSINFAVLLAGEESGA